MVLTLKKCKTSKKKKKRQQNNKTYLDYNRHAIEIDSQYTTFE